MDNVQERSFSRELSLAYAREQIERFQRLLEQFRLCKCPCLGGEECNCVSEDVKQDLIRYQRFVQQMNGKLLKRYVYIIINCVVLVKPFEASPVCENILLSCSLC